RFIEKIRRLQITFTLFPCYQFLCESRLQWNDIQVSFNNTLAALYHPKDVGIDAMQGTELIEPERAGAEAQATQSGNSFEVGAACNLSKGVTGLPSERCEDAETWLSACARRLPVHGDGNISPH